MSHQLDLLAVAPSEVQPAAVEQGWPEWFRPSKTAKTHARRVALGRHPFGARLSDWPGATCGNCAQLLRRKHGARQYLKCARVKATKGPASDARAGWRGCEYWSAPSLYNGFAALEKLVRLRQEMHAAGTDAAVDALVAMDELETIDRPFADDVASDAAHAIAMVALYKAEGCKGIVRRLLEVSR